LKKLNGNKLRSAAPDLYQAAKLALRTLLEEEESRGSPSGQKAIQALQAAIDLAEGEGGAGTITFVVTHRTAKELLKAVKGAKGRSDPIERLVSGLKAGTRKTKRRVYIEMGADPVLLRKLRDILLQAWPEGSSKRAFDRLAKQIEAEVLSKSPLRLLADAGV
jgi:hypothetical protein